MKDDQRQDQELYDAEQLANDIQEIQATDAAEDRAQLLINLQKQLNDVIHTRDQLQADLNAVNDKNVKLSKKLADLFTQITNVDNDNDAEDAIDDDTITADDLM